MEKINESGPIGKAHHNVLRMRHTTGVFLIWHVWGRTSAIARFSHPGLLVPPENDFPGN